MKRRQTPTDVPLNFRDQRAKMICVNGYDDDKERVKVNDFIFDFKRNVLVGAQDSRTYWKFSKDSAANPVTKIWRKRYF